MKKIASMILAVIVLGMPLGCGKSKSAQDQGPKPDPTPLFHATMSYSNFEKTKQLLGLTYWETVEDREPLVSDRRPPFRLLVVRVPNFKDHGFTGDLVLSFYNDRLMKTQFYVANIKDYLNAAGVFLSNDMSGSIPPHTRTWMGKDGDGKTYLGMEDQVLKQQMDDWIVRYSQIG